ncbi:MAG: FHA domain-containing protein [Faecousia sp.]
MGSKRIVCLIIAVMLLLSAAAMVNAVEDTLQANQVKINMPEITVELKGSDFAPENISATLDGDKLALSAVEPYDPDKHTTCVLVLVDISISSGKLLEMVKENLTTYVETMGENDELILVTFGDNVKTLLHGGENKDTILKTVDTLACTDSTTVFYEAINEAYGIAKGKAENFDRTYAIVFSDGADDQKGSISYDELLRKETTGYQTLPFYLMLFSNQADVKDKAAALIRRTGGEVFEMSEANAAEVFPAALQKINEVTLLRFNADSNKADGNEHRLVIQVGTKNIPLTVRLEASIADTAAPTIEDASYDPESMTLTLTFSEPVKEDLHASFEIKDGNGKTVTAPDHRYSQDKTQITVVLSEALCNGSYTITVFGITDISKEENPVSGTFTLTVTNSVNATEPTQEPAEQEKAESGNPTLWILIAVLAFAVIAAIVVAVIVMSTKKQSEKEESITRGKENIYEYSAEESRVKHHVASAVASRVVLTIRTGSGSEQRIETSVSSSMIVGRSSICDLFIDDAKLSRQHFAIERMEGDLFVSDLQSKNGTFLNGTRVLSKQKLQSGDKITAGLSEIYVRLL